MPWRELTTNREERLSLLRLSRGAKEEYDNMSEEERQVIDENTLQDARDMMGLDELEDE